MILVEFRLDNPILRRALTAHPQTSVELERADTADGSRVRALLWAEGGDPEAFLRDVSSDPTVTAPERHADLEDRLLFQVELGEEGLDASLYPTLVDVGAVLHSLTGSHEGWEWRVSFPNHGAVDRFFDGCAERGIDTTVHRLYEERPVEDGPAYGLTEPQRRTLLEAVDVGYLNVPRKVNLQELGERLDVSDTAASQRLRRGMKTLVEHTLGSNAVVDDEGADDPAP